ncbi:MULTISPECIES: HalOD1 output domain-containing protein [Haloarcula]|uniref:HalOD1 output domain-containing protein n=1 Tax=Haloarcula TaxID=2237 RepID=UPI0023E7F601|nr:HalOD1 output domain-containing protein [Halomicroarcula sp. SHR3]
MEHTRNPDTSMTVAVVEAVSSVENCEPTALPPLYRVVDTDALDALFATGPGAGGDRGCAVSFAFSDSHVTIENGERIVVESATETAVASN